MPQLNPAPWLGILILSWFAFLTILPPKITAHSFPNEPTPINSKALKADNWNWPWL
uniref:ATP synthase complex subunit 8 n=1 Tax=Brachirus orientalis TaxID=435138 RepID=A0A0A7CB85_9PLEU|nr:ATP synthase F0 subunit 8 [Brachirus orientalis]AHZ58110.1 ATP synthase F0 subunit 8 [Brachirus orientalis]AID59737.1 ATP synthase F0 subunit 8 [Brachirus orientalis]